MHRIDLSPNVGEDDLHAVVDGQLMADRHHEVMAYLAVYPDAADRVSAFFRQRVELAALRESLADGEPGSQIAGLEGTLCRVVRQQHRVRRALGAGGLVVALIAAASGWWLTVGREPGAPAQVATQAAPERVALGPSLASEADRVAATPGDGAILWLQAQMAGRTLRQPNLEALGLHFAGSNALKSARGPAIRLLYADEGGHPISLFVGVKRSGVELAASLAPEGYVALSWQEEPLVFALVAPQGSPRLSEIMRSAGDLLEPTPISADAGLGPTTATGATGKTVESGAAGSRASDGDLPAVAPRDPAAPGGSVSKPL